MNVRSYWHWIKRNHDRHRLHGRKRWIWGGYKRIGLHRYRQRGQRNVNSHWRRVRAYWHPWRRNHYDKPNRWSWGKSRRIGRQLCRLRIQRRSTGAKWIRVRAYCSGAG